MAKRDSTKVLWQVQVRKSRAHKWVNKGRFETRLDARDKARHMRDREHYQLSIGWKVFPAYGFGNTRIVRVEKA